MRHHGLRCAHEDFGQVMLFLCLLQYHHELPLFQVPTGEAPRVAQPGLHHMAWQFRSLEELQAAHRELKAMGVPVEDTIEHNVTRSVYFPDPDGNRVELYCDMVENGFETMRTLGPKREPLHLE